MFHDFSKMRWTSFSHPSHVHVGPRKEIRDKEVLDHLGFGSVPARQAKTKTSITPSYKVGLGCMNTHWKDFISITSKSFQWIQAYTQIRGIQVSEDETIHGSC